MSYRKQNFAPGEFYHLYNRGTEKRTIFLDEKDCNHFLFLLYICNSIRSIEIRYLGENFDRKETIVDIGAYCLMPNHFHILIREKIDHGISKFMLKVMTAYTMYFNKKYKRTGKLYEGVFKSTHLNTDNYLKYMYSYIHLNPAKLKDTNWKKRRVWDRDLFDYVQNYKYSSFSEYEKDKFTILEPKEFPKYFRNPEEHKKELLEWLAFGINPGGNASGVASGVKHKSYARYDAPN